MVTTNSEASVYLFYTYVQIADGNRVSSMTICQPGGQGSPRTVPEFLTIFTTKSSHASKPLPYDIVLYENF